ncbi:MAG: bifunctional phosphopantothenoylcysteine decarboxylase/phosphopantothenate--cysteine ligase CoaBC [Methanomassiliicoccus sp.]|nr:bifunctional phosphopantothenoylcysteine decarboxylase/phosphopantothenate--cysteine ligase CoaBC [Methanomassiliicoccus sp.]
MHPSETIRFAKGRELEGKLIVLGMTGSIAAVESFELVRELIRHGAEVQVVMTPEAQRLMTPEAMEFASGRAVITKLTGATEHVSLLGDYPGRADMFLVSPCTANTISKMALGIDDTPVTTMATLAIGTHTLMLVAPAMHLAMFENAAVQRNVLALKDMGVELVGPVLVGKKARVASVEEIVDKVLAMFSKGDLCGRKVLIIGGSSEEPVDSVRVVSNTGTGATAAEMVRVARQRGAEVELWAGRMSVPVPTGIPVRSFRSVEDLVSMVGEVDHDVVIVPASLSDYAPTKIAGKMPSGKSSVDLELHPLPKVLPLLRPRTKVLVGFKAEVGVSPAVLSKRAVSRLKEYGLDMIVANDLEDVGQGSTKAIIITADGGRKKYEGDKRGLADAVLDEAVKVLG